jgi:hypothetical protein
MFADVAFEHLAHEAVYSAPHSRNLLEYGHAVRLLFERPFQCFGLSLDAANAREQLTEAAPQREHSLREVFNALRWIVLADSPWRLLPNDFLPWEAVY